VFPPLCYIEFPVGGAPMRIVPIDPDRV